MALIVFKSDAVLEFVPEYSGNREDKAPCVVGLKYVSFAKVQEYAKLFLEKSAEQKGHDEPAFYTQFVQKKQFFDNVVSVRGVFDGSREITDVGEFYNMVPQPLIFELMRTMEDPKKIQAGLLKKLDRKTNAAKSKKGQGAK